MDKKVYVEGYDLVVTPREIKEGVVYFNHESLSQETDRCGSQTINKCAFFDRSIPDDIILDACHIYPIKKDYVSVSYFGDVDLVDKNMTERDAYISGAMSERNKRKIDHVLMLINPQDKMPYYYSGYFKRGWPVVSTDYSKAMKIPYEKEAEAIMNAISESSIFTFQVEKNMYAKDPDVYSLCPEGQG